MARTAAATFGSNDDWNKAFAVVGALVAFNKLPKKWAIPVALVALILALRG